MTKHGLMVKVLAAGLIVALQFLYVPATAATPSAGSLTGSILSATAQEPLAGVTVHAGDPRTGEIFSSGVTAPDGSYRIADLPPSSYELAVESGGLLYVVDTPVQLAPGQSQSVNLAVNADTAPSPEEQEKEEKKRSGTTFWRNPLWAALIVLGGAFAIGAIISTTTDSDPPIATNSAP